jgi:DNA helicase-2/ATP-dependent DNA helicase PcrA
MSDPEWWDGDLGADDSAHDLLHKLHRVIGPPGCGKTTFLSRQILTASDKYGSGGVAVTSLTRAAAAEVAGRRTRLPRQNIGTLHSHAYHALGRPQIVESKEGLAGWNEFAPSRRYRISNAQTINPEDDSASLEMATFENEGEELLNRMNVLRQRGLPVEAWPPAVARFHGYWSTYKKQAGLMDFTDLIVKALEDVDEAPTKPAVLMVDEAQDMSRIEMQLALKWGAAAKQLVIVGDPDQNLYEWRGADPQAFYDGSADSERVLERSWRVPASVHDVAVRWIELSSDRKQVAYQPRLAHPGEVSAGEAQGVVRRERLSWGDPTALCKALEKDLDRTVVETVPDGQGGWVEQERQATVMVLASCGYMLRSLTAELKTRGVLFHNPYRVTQGAWNPMRSVARLQAFLRPDPATYPGGEARLWTWKELKQWVDVLQARGVLQHGSKAIIESRDVGRFADADEQVPLDKVMGFFASDELRDKVLDHDYHWWHRSLKHKERSRFDYAVTIADRWGKPALLDDPRLIVGTIHSVKGGEADIVYVFPDLSPKGFYEQWKVPGAPKNSVYRLFYVAMTRARHELVLCRPSAIEAVKWPS